MSLDPLVLSPDPIRLGHCVAFPAARLYGRPRLLHRCLGRPLSLLPAEKSTFGFPASGLKIFAVVVRHGRRPRGSSCHSRSVRTGVVTLTPPPTSLGPLLAYEGLVAFFLEAAFLGVLLFGRKLVPPWAHFVAALMVAQARFFSTFWYILSTNSWMQTPAGYEIVDGRFVPKDWLQIIFSPSFPYRLAHTVDVGL